MAFEAGEGPLGYIVWDGAGEVEGGEGMQTLYTPVVAADAGDPDTVEPQVFVVGLVYGLGADLLLGLSNAASGLDAGDLCP